LTIKKRLSDAHYRFDTYTYKYKRLKKSYGKLKRSNSTVEKEHSQGNKSKMRQKIHLDEFKGKKCVKINKNATEPCQCKEMFWII